MTESSFPVMHSTKSNHYQASVNQEEHWNFRPKGDGRSGPSWPLRKDRLFWLNVILYLENCAILMLPVDHIENDFGIFCCA